MPYTPSAEREKEFDLSCKPERKVFITVMACPLILSVEVFRLFFFRTIQHVDQALSGYGIPIRPGASKSIRRDYQLGGE